MTIPPQLPEVSLMEDSPELLETAEDFYVLAQRYRRHRMYKWAEPLYLRALMLYEQHWGSEHSEIIPFLSGLIYCSQEQEKYEQTEPLRLRELTAL